MLHDNATQLSESQVQQRIEVMVGEVCASYREATEAHAPGLSAIEIDDLVKQLEVSLQGFVQEAQLVGSYTHQTREQLLVLLAGAEANNQRVADFSEQIQMPLAELEAAISSQQRLFSVGSRVNYHGAIEAVSIEFVGARWRLCCMFRKKRYNGRLRILKL